VLLRRFPKLQWGDWSRVREVMIEGPTGILAAALPTFVPSGSRHVVV